MLSTGMPGDNYSDIWGSSGDHIFAVGYSGKISHYDGSTWSDMEIPTTRPIFSISGTSGGDAFAVGDFGMIFRYGGGRWQSMESRCEDSLYGVHAVGRHVFAVGWDAAILHYARPVLNGPMLLLLQ